MRRCRPPSRRALRARFHGHRARYRRHRAGRHRTAAGERGGVGAAAAACGSVQAAGQAACRAGTRRRRMALVRAQHFRSMPFSSRRTNSRAGRPPRRTPTGGWAWRHHADPQRMQAQAGTAGIGQRPFRGPEQVGTGAAQGQMEGGQAGHHGVHRVVCRSDEFTSAAAELPSCLSVSIAGIENNRLPMIGLAVNDSQEIR